jgi:UPF0716 protein FxsA
MRWRLWVVALLLIPLADSLLLVVVADELGWVTTVALVVLTALLGTLLVRAEGRHVIGATQKKLAAGEPPTDELLDGGLLVAAGAVLLTPGLVTDGLGFLLAVPVTRAPLRVVLKRYVVVPYIDRHTDGLATGVAWTGGFPEPDGETFDVDPENYRVDDDAGEQ